MTMRGETEVTDFRRKGWPVADMSGASLEGACLRRVNLANAIIRGANLRESDLQGANLRKACLYESDLKGANLGGSNLGMADLRLVCLEQANLNLANLNRANLMGARLAGVCLEEADLTGAILPDGTMFSDEVSLARFIDHANPDFMSTLALVEKTDVGDSSGHSWEIASPGYRELPWSQFVEQTYGSLAHDPIDWNPSIHSENLDTRE